jgi:glycosyltransferase involved in cell wall biosynthesis
VASDLYSNLFASYNVCSFNRCNTDRALDVYTKVIKNHSAAVVLHALNKRHMFMSYSTAHDAASIQYFLRNVTVGVVANEFFSPGVGRMGGFGWSTGLLGRVFQRRSDLGVKLIFIFADPRQRGDKENAFKEGEVQLHGWPLINLLNRNGNARQNGTKKTAAKKAPAISTNWAQHYLKKRQIDLLLFIDFRDDYLKVRAALPQVPIILWARDPRTQEQTRSIHGIRIPGEASAPQGRSTPNATGAGKLWRKKLAIAVTWMPALQPRLSDAYGIPPSAAVQLPNIIEMGAFRPKDGVESPSPTVVFLARVDPYKRPWLLVPLAHAFPQVTFIVAGRSHMHGKGSYRLPPTSNIKTMGHVGEAEKKALLEAAWFVINLSVQEGVAVSFLEALACATPIVALVNPGGLVSSYGRFVGDFPGDGIAAMEPLKRAVDELLSNRGLRRDLGTRGRAHVMTTHNEPQFLKAFARLLDDLPVAKRKSHCFKMHVQSTNSHSPPTSSLMVSHSLDPDSLEVSVVVPSFSRVNLLASLLAHCLALPSFAAGRKSEVLIAHASNASLAAVTSISAHLASICSHCDLSKVSHLDMVAENIQIGCAIRYLAATRARNAIVIHIDDDLLPRAGVLSQLAARVAGGNVALAGPSSSTRWCGANGYCFPHAAVATDTGSLVGCIARPRCSATSDLSIVMTNLAAVPFDINRRFVDEFERGRYPYRALMKRTHGNGCDLIFNFFLYQHGLGSNLSVLHGHGASHLRYPSGKTKGYSDKDDHYLVRSSVCRCFAAKGLEQTKDPELAVNLCLTPDPKFARVVV